MIEELEVVVLTRDLAEHGLVAGALGTVVHRFRNGTSFLVEFVREDGSTITVEELTIGEIRPLTENEIGHARRLSR